MRRLFSHLPLLLLSLAAVSPAVQGNSPMAKTPHSIRQTYEDGTFTEMTCINDRLRHNSKTCSFLVSQHGTATSFSFSIDELGYHDSVDSYGYLPIPGEKFLVTFLVTCGPFDLALHPDATEENANCYLTLESGDQILKPQEIQMSGEGAKGFFYVTRTLKPSFPSEEVSPAG
jgi:hypothetical protein